MSRISSTLLIGIVAISLGSCSGTSTSNSDTAEIAQQNSPTPSTESNSSDSEVFEEVDLQPSNTEVSGLIPPTNSNTRVQATAKGRQDPFALISVRPKVQKVEKPSEEQKSTPATPSKPQNGKKATSSPQPSSLPTLPRSSLAKEVVVSGVIEVKGVTRAIVKAPQEANSRYVEAGQYLSNGQVLVKQIVLGRGFTPYVILQQNGTEITKKVGDTLETDQTDPNQELTSSVRIVSNF